MNTPTTVTCAFWCFVSNLCNFLFNADLPLYLCSSNSGYSKSLLPVAGLTLEEHESSHKYDSSLPLISTADTLTSLPTYAAGCATSVHTLIVGFCSVLIGPDS